ncbi:MAG: NifB/NifX family molybdenum-iron cluster-binding protein [Campylobacterota bacterium]|nr:NifB/NifX family molybdenum-iron cluster-binding protein [Campylobacterota bacterium]
MLAIPIDNQNSTTLSKLYGKAPYFALLNTHTGNFRVIENEVVGKGPKSAEFLKEQNATATIFYHMGEGVYKSFEKNSMDVYCANYNQYSIEEIYRSFLNGSTTKLDSTNFQTLLDPGEGEVCKCGCETK